MSLLIISCAVCIFWYRSGSPMIRAAFLTSRHVSSSREMVRTMVPSSTSVRPVMFLKLMPRAHSCTTSMSPNRGLHAKSLLSSDVWITWCSSCTRLTFSLMVMIVFLPFSRLPVSDGSMSDFSWNTKADSSAAISAGS